MMTYLLPVALAELLSVASAVVCLVVIVSAFRRDVVQGLLTLFVPFYVLYYAFARFEHPRRRPLLWIMYGGPPAAFALGMIPVLASMGALATR